MAPPRTKTPKSEPSQTSNATTSQAEANAGTSNQGSESAKLESRLRVKGSTVLVKVGSGKKQHPFYIHKALLCANSEYFRKALTGPFQEAETGVVRLKDNDPVVFTLYVNFLYERKLLLKDDDFVSDRSLQATRGLELIAKAWILGDFLQDVSFMDASIDLLTSKTNPIPPNVTLIRYVYRNTVSGSNLRKLVVDIWAWFAGAQWFKQSGISWFDQEFLFDLACAMSTARPPLTGKSPPFRLAQTCHYHQHKEEQTCHKLT